MNKGDEMEYKQLLDSFQKSMKVVKSRQDKNNSDAKVVDLNIDTLMVNEVQTKHPN